MKKLVLLISLLVIPFIVNAESYEQYFQTPIIHTNNTYNLFYGDDFLFIDGIPYGGYTHDKILVSHYDKKGNYIKSSELQGIRSNQYITDGKDIFAYGWYNGVNNIIKISPYADEEEEEYGFRITSHFYSDLYSITGYILDFSVFEINNNKINVLAFNPPKEGDTTYKCFEIDKNLEEYEFKNISACSFYDRFVATQSYEFEGNENMAYIINYKDGYLLETYNLNDRSNEGIISAGKLIRMDKNHNVLWTKTYDGFLYDLTVTDKGAYALRGTNSNNNLDNGIVSIDENGNIEMIDIEINNISGLIINNKYIAVSQGTFRACLGASEFEEEGQCKSAIQHTVYEIEYDITPKVTEGKGEIKVASKSFGNKGVTFEVIPAEGYVLSEVKVTDALGNIITFHDYTFTMPDANVLIEVKFVPANPNTKTFISISLISIGIISLLAMYILVKNRKEFKK